MTEDIVKCLFCNSELTSTNTICDSCHRPQLRGTLADREIKQLIEKDIIVVDPILDLDVQLTPAGIDLRLDVYFRELQHMKRGVIDLATELPSSEFYRLKELDLQREGEEYYFIQPGDFVLAQSLEYVSIPSFIYGRLGGRSALAKSVIEVHATSEKIDPGFKGHLTFELKNIGKMPVRLYPLQRVANLMFEVISEVDFPYKGAFQHQVRIKPPKPDKDLTRWLKFLQGSSGGTTGMKSWK